MSIIVTNNLIVTQTGILTLCTAKVMMNSTEAFIVPSGNTISVDDYLQLERDTLSSFKGVTESVEAKKAYDQTYEQWAQYRRKHRHENFMILPRSIQDLDSLGVRIVDTDNMYLDKFSFQGSTLLWKYGVRTIRPNKLSTWLPESPEGWVRRTWSELINRR